MSLGRARFAVSKETRHTAHPLTIAPGQSETKGYALQAGLLQCICLHFCTILGYYSLLLGMAEGGEGSLG